MSRERYAAALEQTQLDLLEMGGHAEEALKCALESVINSDRSAAEHTRNLEVEIDSCNKHIYQRCLSLLTLQAPVAGDARLLTRILEAIVDLELTRELFINRELSLLAFQRRVLEEAEDPANPLLERVKFLATE